MLIVAGCVVAVAFASHSDPTYTLEILFGLYATLTFGLYASLVTVCASIVMIVVWYIERVEKRNGTPSPEYQWWFRIHRFAYPCVSGIIGAQSILFAKTLVELLTVSVS